VRYILDDNPSRFTVRAFSSGMLSMMGHSPTIAIRKFTGEAEYDSAAPAQASLRVTIRADSLEVTDDISGNDRKEIESAMQQKVLEISKYPEIVFEAKGASASQNRITMNGSLTLHGDTQRLPVTAQVNILGDMIRMTGEFSILQSDYSIPLVSVAGGALKLKDQLKFAFDIVARKQD
jgi:polyisoprenoid-binding protein YceI